MKIKCLRTLKWGMAFALAGMLTGNTDVHAQQSQFVQHGGQAFPVVQASDAMAMMATPMETAPLTNLDNAIQQVGHHCNGSCGTGQCGGSCSGMNYGGGSSMYGAGASCNSGGCMECPTCEPYKYARVEAVYMRREDMNNFTRSQLFELDEYDFEWAPRVTFGSVPDCVNGTEVSFTGPLNWETSTSRTGINGRTFLTESYDAVDPDVGFVFLYDPTNLADSANDAIALQRQRYESTYWTAEAVQTMMAWDIAKFSFGGRFVSFEEEYSYTASNGVAAVDNGRIASDATNNMIGLQVGLEIFTPVCNNVSSFIRGKAGAYWNLSEGKAIVEDQGERLYRSSDDDGGLAGLFELSSGLQYQLGELLAVHAGTELWYMTEVATAENQIPSLVGLDARRRNVNSGDDVLFLGFNFGATLKF
ncbi:hypothetical protein [Neorhodopirellula lusitana]|nr:hypothetical protein [Neorhodopirellula lusitana]